MSDAKTYKNTANAERLFDADNIHAIIYLSFTFPYELPRWMLLVTVRLGPVDATVAGEREASFVFEQYPQSRRCSSSAAPRHPRTEADLPLTLPGWPPW